MSAKDGIRPFAEQSAAAVGRVCKPTRAVQVFCKETRLCILCGIRFVNYFQNPDAYIIASGFFMVLIGGNRKASRIFGGARGNLSL